RSAEGLFHGCRSTVAASARARPGEAPCDRGAVEELEEGVLLEPEPAAERPPRPALPRQTGLRLDATRGEAVEVGPLARAAGEHRSRDDREPRLEAPATARVPALERRDRTCPAHRGERTTTNQGPACSTSPPPSSSSRWLGSNQRLYTRQVEPSRRTRSDHSSAVCDRSRDASAITSSGATRRASRRNTARCVSSRGPKKSPLTTGSNPSSAKGTARARPWTSVACGGPAAAT